MNKRSGRLKKILIGIGLFILISVILCTVGFICLWNSETVNEERLSGIVHPVTFYADDGTVIDSVKTRKYCKLEDINRHCINGFIALEDKDFYSHNGLYLPRIVKAAFNNMRAGYSKEGASTITQQLIKNTHLTHEKTIRRKLREAVLAMKLEQQYTKDEILEMYLNTIYFGNNIYGIENAGEFYFGKSPAQLSAAESAALAGMVQSPKKFDPITNHKTFIQKARLVLSLMHEQGYLTDDEYRTAMKDKIAIADSGGKGRGGIYQSAALTEASRLLNLSEADIANYGYQIETYYDKTKQELIYQYTRDIKTDKFIMLSQPSGQVSALWTSAPTLLTARRNFGSAIKPLLVYAPALELGVVSPESKVDDSPLIDTDFRPQNMDRQYHGWVSVRDAVTSSMNIPAVKIMNTTTVEKSCEIANLLGLSLENENLSAALGNTSKGVSFAELAAGYQTIANGGKTSAPKFIKSIRDRNGKTIYFDTISKYNYTPQVIGEDTAYILTDMLLDVTRHGTGRKLSYLGIDIASKTGTTQRENADTNTDATFISYTPENVLVVWTGNVDMRPENDLPKGTVGGSLGFAVREIHRNISKPNVHFKKPNSVTEVKLDNIDYKNGDIKIANEKTPDSETHPALFSARYVPIDISTNYLAAVCPTVDGKIGDNNTPQIWFDALPHQTYEIYKNGTLQEVITHKSGRHLFTDKNPAQSNIYCVRACVGEFTADSSKITLRLPDKNTEQRIEKRTVPWYF
jgi:membrane peptidoglycan carboxypeptidase